MIGSFGRSIPRYAIRLKYYEKCSDRRCRFAFRPTESRTMKNVPIYEALAQAFAAEGVDTHFTLMGDGNMHWATAMKNLDGMASFSARHEHCACAMAMGYHLATGKVGVASVTCGPGFTQITTALTV